MTPSNRSYRIATIGGDGIGPEVLMLIIPILDYLAQAYGFSIQWKHLPLGAQHYLDTGESMSDATFADLRDNHDAILFGAVGDPRVPPSVPRDILLGLRKRLDLFVNFRPGWLLDPSLCRLVGQPKIDIVVFREGCAGNYDLDCNREEDAGAFGQRYINEERYTEDDIRRIIRAAFVWAKANGRKKVTLADKSNAVVAHAAWRRIFKEIAADFPEITHNMMYVDAVAHDLIVRPTDFDVIVTTNIYGDILSDQVSALVGGLGVAPSLNLHPGQRPFLAEPVHGSAPTLVGKNTANPYAFLLTAALMLRELGERNAALTLEQACVVGVVVGKRTPDIGGTSTTSEVVDYLLQTMST